MINAEGARDIIAYCLKPLGLNEAEPATKETVQRLVQAMENLKNDTSRTGRAPSCGRAPAIVINEEAHGYDA